jgi:hypothetical protein
MYLYAIVKRLEAVAMTNIKISDKGKAFLKRGNAAAQVASAIATKKNNLQSEEGVVVIIGDTSVTVRSAAAYSPEVAEA